MTGATFLEGDIKNILNITAVHKSSDYNLPKNLRFNYTTFPMKQCEISDFPDDEVSQGYFKSWEGYSIFCPDFSEN